eukprot:m.105726 g.105726  ORF g.105726 m.105726 type:complete len:1030 (+) comp15129_c0_seq1:201-3290(+)
MSDSASSLKDKGNALFKEQKYKEALATYTQALKAAKQSSKTASLVLPLLKNIAAANLKLSKYQDAVDVSSQAIALAPSDTKALYRRSQAYEALNDLNNAFRDMATASRLEPSNKHMANEARRLMASVSKTINQQQTTEGISAEMLNRVFSPSSLETQQQALKNCVVIAREDHGAQQFMKNDAYARFLSLLDSEDEDIRVHTLFLYSALVENSTQRTALVTRLLAEKGKEQIDRLLQQPVARQAKAIMRIYAKGLEAVSASVEGTAAMPETITAILRTIIDTIKNRKASMESRAAAVNAIMSSAKRADVGKRFLSLGGVRALLIIAALCPSPLQEAAASKTATSSKASTEEDEGSTALGLRGAISVTLQHIYLATKAKGLPDEQFVADCANQIKFGDDPVANVTAANVLIAVMAAVVDIGNQILEQNDVFPHLMKMAQTDDLDVQCIAAEAIAHAASDKKRARGIVLEGFPILKALYSKDLPEAIRVRALCGLCKMASVGSGAKNLRSMSETSMINLAKKLRPLLIEPGHSDDVRKWAAEGMAYLSLDADVKELIVNDTEILAAVRKVCLGADTTIQFSMANMLVNLTNSFDKPEKSEEQEQLKKLGKFAGENLPEPHEKDANEFVLKRIDTLVKEKFVTALVQLAKSESEGTREQVARVLFAMTEKQENRGVVVAQGGAKALLDLARNNTDKGVVKAAHALAKICITSDPSLSFPGQRMAELIKPLVKLSRERNGLMMFEAAMALTNLASVDDTMRNKMLQDKAISRLEDMMFDDDPLIRRAATEGLCNCFYSDKVFEQFATKEGTSFERLKLWILFSGVEQDDFDLPTCRAASGGLALLSSSEDVCGRIVQEKQGLQILKELLVCGEAELQHRGLHIVRNMVSCSKDIAKHFVEQEMLMIITALDVTATNDTIKSYASSILEILVQHGLIASVDEVRKSSVEAAHQMAAMRARLQEEARARAEAAEEGDVEEDEDDSEDAEDSDQDAKQTETIVADQQDEQEEFVAPARPDDEAELGPKVEVLDESSA